MANELHEKGSTIPTQDIPVDDAETQLLPVNIQVPDPIVAEPPIGHCSVAFCRRLTKLVCFIFFLVFCWIIYAIYSLLKYDECCEWCLTYNCMWFDCGSRYPTGYWLDEQLGGRGPW